MLLTLAGVAAVLLVFVGVQPASADNCGRWSLICGTKWWDLGLNTGSDTTVDNGLGTSCKSSPIPQMPGSGISGWLDPGPPVFDAATPITDKTVYATVLHPPKWHTYDLGCVANAVPLANTDAATDTMIGNWFMGAATAMVSLTNSLTRTVSPPTFLNAFDPLVTKGTDALNKALYDPYIGLSLLVLGVLIIWSARRQNMPHALTTAAWALLVMTVVTGVFSYPVAASHWSDNFATAAAAEINQNVLGTTVTPTGIDPGAELLTDTVLYKNWCRGELGNPDTNFARYYCPLLLKAQTYTYTERAEIAADQTKAAGITKKKRDSFNQLAQAIKKDNPDAYNYLQGANGDRAGSGFIAALTAALVIPFQIIAHLILLTALILQRFIVIFLPAIGAIAIQEIGRKYFIATLKTGAAALLNGLAAIALAAVDTLAIGYLLGGATGLAPWLNALCCGVVTVILWAIMRPLRRLHSMVSPSEIGASIDSTLHGTKRHLFRAGHRARDASLPRWRFSDSPDGDEPDDMPDMDGPVRSAAADTPESWTPTNPFGADIAGSRQTVPHDLYNVRVAPDDAHALAAPVPDAVDWGDQRVALPSGEPTVLDADTPLPDDIRYAEPFDTDNGVVYRIWDSDTQTVKHVNAAGEEVDDE